MLDFDPSTASHGQTIEWLTVVASGLHEYIEEQARRISQARVDKARAERDLTVSAVENRMRICETAISELRRQRDALRGDLQQASDFITRQYRHDWMPRPYQAPLTPEQRMSLERNECRSDWPAYIQPCDPVIKICAETGVLSVSCAKTGLSISSGDGEWESTWSDLVDVVAKHRCDHE